MSAEHQSWLAFYTVGLVVAQVHGAWNGERPRTLAGVLWPFAWPLGAATLGIMLLLGKGPRQ